MLTRSEWNCWSLLNKYVTMHGPENEKCITILFVLFCLCIVIQISLSPAPHLRNSATHLKRFIVSEDKCVSEQAILMRRTALATLSVYWLFLRNGRKHFKHIGLKIVLLHTHFREITFITPHHRTLNFNICVVCGYSMCVCVCVCVFY